MSIVIGLDPGTERSAIVVLELNPRGSLFPEKYLEDNKEIERLLKQYGERVGGLLIDEPKPIYKLAIEAVQNYGMPVGKTIFDTVYWCGVFAKSFEPDYEKRHKRIFMYPRPKVKAYITGQARGKDPDVRRSLISRFGEVGTKKKPGPLYGFKEDMWSALAVAVYHMDGAKLGGWE